MSRKMRGKERALEPFAWYRLYSICLGLQRVHDRILSVKLARLLALIESIIPRVPLSESTSAAVYVVRKVGQLRLDD